ncbi:HCNGP-domain-containing protein [Athelia psychrophila]|uniref:HCNGP-domain-containing protein n=1 Tax=Athelia psychrophila TaxID=1759441 RepID=A0A166WKY4_9AGAM|nr:HCNGP-domain-containing protein [Fibularhizoctonia sp. CBS 109695]
MTSQPRAYVSKDIDEDMATISNAEASGSSTSTEIPLIPGQEPATSEILQIRAFLQPPSIPGVEDWGIPPETTEPCDPEIEAKLAQFAALKRDPQHPKHFNDSLMSNRSFRNPHLYAKLVEFVDVDERTTNFPMDIWNPGDMRPQWFAEAIAERQKAQSEQHIASQTPGKRSRVEFTKESASAGGRESGRKNRLDDGGKQQSYMYGEGSSKDSYSKDRKKTRWG